MYNSSILKTKIFTIFRICAVFLTLTAFSLPAFSEENHAEGAEKPFEPSEVILEHIADSHSLHVFGHTHIALPVILYTDKGLEVFSSSEFGHDNSEEYKGKYYTYAIDKDVIHVVDENGTKSRGTTVFDFNAKFTDLSITRNIVSMWMSIILLLIIFFSVASAYKKRAGKAPKGLQSFL
jgi:F-type H+-transporting ATPase subunit a